MDTNSWILDYITFQTSTRIKYTLKTKSKQTPYINLVWWIWIQIHGSQIHGGSVNISKKSRSAPISMKDLTPVTFFHPLIDWSFYQINWLILWVACLCFCSLVNCHEDDLIVNILSRDNLFWKLGCPVRNWALFSFWFIRASDSTDQMICFYA